MSIESLVRKQNADGGWPYIRGRSWTEPTVYAVMALLASGRREPAARGLRWLADNGRADGGWPPQPAVDQSAWVTALVALLPTGEDGVPPARHDAAIGWLMSTIGHESTFGYRLREWLLGRSVPPEMEYAGWPWIPGAAAWVGPTAAAILALDKEHRRRPSAAMAERIATGRHFLLRRMCHGGGWNHGSARPLGYDSNPYPETTGMALAALRGVRSPKVDRSLALAREFLSLCRSADALNWLRLGLLAHGELPAGYCGPRDLACRTVCETGLDLILSKPGGQGFFWEAA